MATQREPSKLQGGWLPSSPLSLNAQTGWGAAPSSGQAKKADEGTEQARGQEPQPRYLTTSGLFERPPGPPAWKEAILDSGAAPGAEPSELVNDFRSALGQPQSKEVIPIWKIRKEVLALAVVGILLAATGVAIYLYRPRESAAQFRTARTWMAKEWASKLQQISNAFHPQAAGPSMKEPNRRRVARATLRERPAARPGIPAAPPKLLETPTDPSVTPLVLYITDSFGRRWMLTPAGEEIAPVGHLADPSAAKPEARLAGLKDCRSLFYPGCP